MTELNIWNPTAHLANDEKRRQQTQARNFAQNLPIVTPTKMFPEYRHVLTKMLNLPAKAGSHVKYCREHS